MQQKSACQNNLYEALIPLNFNSEFRGLPRARIAMGRRRKPGFLRSEYFKISLLTRGTYQHAEPSTQ